MLAPVDPGVYASLQLGQANACPRIENAKSIIDNTIFFIVLFPILIPKNQRAFCQVHQSIL